MLSNHPSVLGSGAAGVTTPAAASAALDLISSTQGEILYRNATEWIGLDPGTSGQLLSTQGAAANPIWVTATGGAGDVNGPTLGTATDNAIVRFDGTGGKTVQNSAVTIADTTGSTTWSNAGAVLTVAGTTSASTSLLGALVVGNGTAATSVGIGGGKVYAGTGFQAGAAFTPVAFGSTSLDINDPSGGIVALYSAGTATGYLHADTASTITLQARTGSSPRMFNANAKGISVGSTSAGDVSMNSTTSASTSLLGALVVGNGTAATSVGIGGGNINAGGTGTFGGAVTMQASQNFMGVDGSAQGYLRLYSGSNAGRQSNVYTAAAGGLVLETAGNAYPVYMDGSRVTISSTTASTGVGTGALQVAGGIYAGAASVFGGAVTASSTNANGFGQVSLTNNISAAINQYMLGSTYGGTAFGGATGNNQAVIEASSTTSSLYVGTGGATSIILAPNRTAALTLASGGAATFAGAVAIGNTVSVVSPTSPNRTITIVVGGVTLYIAAKTTND